MFVPSSLILTIVSVGAKVRSNNSKDEKALLSHLIAGINCFYDEEENIVVKTKKVMEGPQPPPQRWRINVTIKSEQVGATTFGEKSSAMLNIPNVTLLSLGRSIQLSNTIQRNLWTVGKVCNAGVCGPSYCDCYANSWLNNETDVTNQVPCAKEIYNLCNRYTDAYGNEWSMAGCVSTSHVTKLCVQPNCDIVDGGTLAECMCQSSISYLTVQGDLYQVSNE